MWPKYSLTGAYQNCYWRTVNWNLLKISLWIQLNKYFFHFILKACLGSF